MLSRLRVFLLILVIAVLGLVLQGCASGVRVLGEVPITENVIRKYVQIGSEGHDSPRITIIESFDISKDGVVVQGSEYHAYGDGLVTSILKGTGAAVAQGGGVAAGAYLRRPDIYNSSTVQSGGGATASGSGTGGAGGVSSSSSSSDQSLSGGNTNVTNTASGGAGGSGGCPGNSCGQGGHGNGHDNDD